MELKTISFKGVTRTPDNIAAPGDLAIAMNVVNDGAGLEMMEQPEVVFELQSGETFLAIHKGTGYLHYITDILSGTTHTMYYVTVSSNIVSRTLITTTNGAPSVEIIGNTIIYNDADGIHYVLWKDGAYINLGQKPPRIDIQFGLEATLRSSGSSIIDVDVDIDDQYETSTYDLQTDTIPADLNDWKPLLVDQETRVPTAGGERAVDALIGKLTEAVMAKVNKLVADITEDNHFCNPFFVRYAYRMFDGSHIMHSYPVLVIPNTKGPICASRAKSNGGVRGDGTHLFVQMDETEALAFDAKLQYRIAPCNIQQLENWRDLITGIDIFVSAPIYPYNQAGKVSKVTNATAQPPISSSADENLNNYTGSAVLFEQYLKGRISNILKDTRTNLGTRGQWMSVAKVAPDQVSGDYAFLNDSAFDLGEYYTTPSLFYAAMLRHAKTVYDYEKGVRAEQTNPDYTDYEGQSLSEVAMAWLEENKSFEKQLRSCGVFYQLTELSFDKLLSIVPSGYVTEMFDVPIDEGVVSTITTRTTMDDDYLTHDIRSGGTMVNYNHRLLLGDFSTTPHNPIPVFTQWARCDRKFNFIFQNRIYWTMREWHSEAVDLKHTEGESVVRSNFSSLNTNALLPAFVFYPNPDARTAEFYYTEDVTDETNHSYVNKYITIPLKPHETLNAAVFSDGVMYNAVGLTGDTSTISASTTTRPVVHASELIASNTDNPFSFAPANQDKIGSGRIIALCPAVRPLSEGQFGYANLYVFTTDGVWAMQVSTKDGTFSNIAPITRDVLSDGCKPLSLDTSVVFQAPRGIMLLTGSKAQCISEVINGNVWRVPNISNTLYAALGSDAIKEAVTDLLNTPTSAPALMAYDYTNQRVYVTPLNKAFSWVYNLKSGMWTQSSTHVTSAVNTYPGCVFAEDDNVVELKEDRFDRCAIITRPLCFAPLALQKIRELKGLTVDDGGTWCSVLWATRDWRRYAAIKSNMGEHPRMFHMGGSPWKAHVLGLFYTGNSELSLTHDTIMSIAGASIAYDVEQNNRMR